MEKGAGGQTSFPLKLVRTEHFGSQFKKLVGEESRLEQAIARSLTLLLRYPPPHPSLRMKRVRGTPGVWECSVNLDIRITFEFGKNNTVILRNIDHHDKSLAHP